MLELYTFNICSSIVIKKLSKKSSEAGFKYLIINGLSSCILLFGLSFIYFSSGVIDFNELNKFIYFASKFHFLNLLYVGYFFLAVGFLIKLVIFPFSLLLLNIYKNIPNNFLFFFLIFPKFAFVIVFYFITYNFSTINYVKFTSIFLYLLIITCFAHALLSLYSLNLKNLIINYSLSNSFFFISPIFYKSVFFLPAFFNYIFVYFINMFCFFSIFFIICFNFKFITKKINSLISLYYINNNLVILIAINALSLISLPPFYGFFVKFYLFYFLLELKMYIVYFVLSFANLIFVYVFLRLIRLLFLKKRNFNFKTVNIKKNFLLFLILFLSAINSFAVFYFDFIYSLFFIILNYFIVF